jgi:hypothetical protein
MKFISFMRLFSYMRTIYHMSSLMSRKIWITPPGGQELPKMMMKQKGYNREVRIGRWKANGFGKQGSKQKGLRQGILYKADQLLKMFQ